MMRRRAGRRRTAAGLLAAVGGLGAVGAFVGCAHEGALTLEAPRGGARTPELPSAPDVPLGPMQYLVADPIGRGAGASASTRAVTPLGKTEGTGVIVDGLRVVLTGPRMHAAKDVADPALVSAERLPASMGGGFLFHSSTSLFTSDAFDGPLRPLVAFPDAIAQVSFGPRAILVRAQNGERWLVDAKTGAPAPMAPLGLVDVAAVPDGRAAAITEFGGAFVSGDRGEHWIDVAQRFPSAVDKLLVHDDAVYMTASSNGSGSGSGNAGARTARVEVGGALSFFDKPPTVTPDEMRPKDPRWKADEPPLRRALRLGAPLDDGTALVVSEGNVVKVDLRSGELVSVMQGRLPPDATCEAVRTQDDVVAACTRTGGPAFLASHVLADKAPVIEQTFLSAGTFSASDDGSIAYSAPCSRTKGSARVACVRSASGSWQELDLDAVATMGDAGAGPTGGAPAAVPDPARWVPRPDGGAWGVFFSPKPGAIDARTGEVHMWRADALPTGVRSLEMRSSRYKNRDTTGVVDRTWTATNVGTLRGWTDNGVVEIGVDGSITTSPFSFDRTAVAGAFAFARTKDGRAWQTVDRGASWAEVQAPFASRPDKFDPPRFCSAVGCDLAAWYRIGWTPTAPATTAPPQVADAAPYVSAPQLPRLACRPTGEAKVQAVARTEHSPDDLGLGASHLPVVDDTASNGNGPNIEYVRLVHARALLVPARGTDTAPDRDEASARVLLSGYSVDTDGDRIHVNGPVRDAMALRRNVAFVAPFDVGGAVRRTSFGVAEIMASARALGVSAGDVLSDDPTGVWSFAPTVPTDPAAPSDLAFLGASGLVGALRATPGGGARTRVGMRNKPADETYPVSAVSLGGEELAVLAVDGDGLGHVFKWNGATALPVLFDVPAPPSSKLVAANPDALALGAKPGELVVVRTPSGGTPPSASDPALVFAPSAGTSSAVPVAALAAWSALLPEGDAACKADPGGYRVIVQGARPWVGVSGPALRQVEDAPFLARVRWTASHVCVEALEIRVADVKVTSREKTMDGAAARVSPLELDAESCVVVRFTGTPAAARVAVIPGAESRQTLECTFAR